MLRNTSRKSHRVIGAAACLMTLGLLTAPASAEPKRGYQDHHGDHKTVYRESNDHRGSRYPHGSPHHAQTTGHGPFHTSHNSSHRTYWGFNWSFGNARGHHDRDRGSGVSIGFRCDAQPRYETHRRWVPGYYETRTEEVCVRPGYYKTRVIKVWVPGCWVTQKVLVHHTHGPSCSVHANVRF